MDWKQCAAEWRDFEATRPSLPGEHLAVAGLGVGLILSALASRSGLGTTLKAMVGGALLVRAATGKDGLCQLLDKPATPPPEAEQVELGRS